MIKRFEGIVPAILSFFFVLICLCQADEQRIVALNVCKDAEEVAKAGFVKLKQSKKCYHEIFLGYLG